MTKKQVGVTVGVLASLMWAFEGVFAKQACLNAGVLHTAAVRAAIIALIALLYALVTARGRFRIDRRQFSAIVYTACIGTLFSDFLFLYALTMIPVTNAMLIGHLQPVFIILIGYFVLKSDRITKNDYAGITLLIVASLLVTTRTTENLAALRLGTRGDALMLLAALGWSTSAIAMRKYLTGMSAGVMAFYRFSIAALALFLLLLVRGGLAPPNHHQLLMGLSVGLGFIFYCEGIIRIKAAQVAALELCSPFFAAILAFLMLAEMITPMQATGIAVLFLGVHYISKRE